MKASGGATVYVNNGEDLRLYETGNANYVGFKAPSLTADKIWTLPTGDGTANQVLVTNGSAVLSWASSSTTGNMADGTAANPGLPFGSDLDTGFYLIGANSLGLSLGGVGSAVVNLGATQTLTNKTLTAPAISQVVFPATQDPSAGANTLDDYEEGSWTPVIQGDSTAGAQTYSAQVGKYVKIGRLVTCTAFIAMTAKGGTTAGNIQVGGLPFAHENVTSSRSCAAGSYSDIDLSAGKSAFSMILITNTSVLLLVEEGDNVASAQVVAAAIAATTSIHLSITYLAAA